MNAYSFLRAAALAVLLALSMPPAAIGGDEAEVRTTFRDISKTYGRVPGFFRLFANDDIADVWFAFRLLELNPYLDTEAKTRELISVAVATQGPCRACVYFHAASALANGATAEEIREAVGIGAATRTLNDAFMDARADIDTFKRETDLILWGDAATVEARGPDEGFCAFIIAWAGAEYVGCD